MLLTANIVSHTFYKMYICELLWRWMRLLSPQTGAVVSCSIERLSRFFNCCDCPTRYHCISWGRYEIQSATFAYMVTRFGFSQLYFWPAPRFFDWMKHYISELRQCCREKHKVDIRPDRRLSKQIQGFTSSLWLGLGNKMVKLRIKILLVWQTHTTLPWCWVGLPMFEIKSQDKMMLYVQNIFMLL